MKYAHWPLLALLSFSAVAEVDFIEKKNRVEFLEQLSETARTMNIEAYRRELQYEKQNVPLERRAEIEANLLAEKIKVQISKAYEVSLETNSPEEAEAEIVAAIEKDLLLVAPEFKQELRGISLVALRNAKSGVSEPETRLLKLQKVILKGVQDRWNYLNQEGEDSLYKVSPAIEVYNPSALMNQSADADRSTFISKADLLESLVSDRQSSRWVSTSNTTIRGDQIVRTDGRIGIQLKVNFMGVDVEAGPTILFKRELRTSAVVSGEGLHPVILANGSFDFLKRDKDGKVIISGGKIQKRFFNFTCEATLDFDSDYSGGGGFFVSGLGGSASVTKTYSNSVSVASRRVAVPELIEGQQVSIKLLNEICHKDFLRAKITNIMTVSDSLNIMMKNTLSGVRFSHPKTKCLFDNHCGKWFQSEVLAFDRVGNVPRCVENGREKFRGCELRGKRGQSCPVFNASGKLISEGKQEFVCDIGLTCVKVQEEGWLKSAKGKCR